MPEFCSCGAQLPPDARFCHKCGKPQRDETLVIAEGPDNAVAAGIAPGGIAPSEVAPMPLSFRNPIAVRVGFFAAGLVCVMMMIPGLNYASILWLLAAGFFSVWFYKRRTGQPLSVRSGARMGWITGVISFAMLMIIFALGMLAVQQVGGFAALRDGLRDLSLDRRTIDEAIKRLQDPYEVVWFVFMMFVIMTFFCSAGGAIGAKMLSKD